MKKCIQSVAMVFVLLAMTLSAQATPMRFKEKKDYAVVPSNRFTPKVENGNKIHVVEFFSYGCPWCFRLEPALDKWLKAQPKDLAFSRVPVQFEAGWNAYARTFYTLQALGKEKQLGHKVFNAIHKEHLSLKSDDALANFFEKQGIPKKEFISAYKYSPIVDAKMIRSKELMQAYQVYAVPSFVVGGRYRTDLRMAGGNNKKLLEIVDFLVQKVRGPQPAAQPKPSKKAVNHVTQ
jgi:protein dithiol oxidoreductase (disulfide-forming)